MKAVAEYLRCLFFLILIYYCPASYILGQTREAIWDYPIKPGMTEWASIKTDIEKFNACQIPQNILDTLPTADLLELCIYYPLFHRITLYDNMLLGMDALSGNFNGFSELSNRNDLDSTLIERYRSLQIPTNFASLSEAEIKRIVAEAWRLEIIIVRLGLSDKCRPEYLLVYIEESYKKYLSKRNNPNIFSSFSYVLPLHILTKSLSVISSENGDQLNCNSLEYRNLVEHLIMPSAVYESSILVLAEIVLKDSINYSHLEGYLELLK